MAVAKKHRVNDLFRQGTNHFDNWCSYILRNDGENAAATKEKLIRTIKKLSEIQTGRSKAREVNIVTIPIAGQEVTVCNWCESPATHQARDAYPEHPHLCEPCVEFGDDFEETTGCDRTLYKPDPALQKVAAML